MALAAAVRLPFVFLPPTLSDDIYRLRWDGRVLADGVDPYRFPPAHPALARLRDEEAAKINHPDVPTVYGPLAAALLAGLALSPAEASPRTIKAVVGAFDLVTVAALVSLGGGAPAGTLAAFLFAVHPLAVHEGAGEGHLDGVAAALLLASLALLRRSRPTSAALVFALAGLVKLTPLAAAPALLRAVGWRRSLLAAGLFLAAHLPFAASLGPLRGLAVYAESWEANGVLFPEVRRGVEAAGLPERAKAAYGRLKAALGHPAVLDRGWRFFHSGFAARLLLLVAFAGLSLLVLRRVADDVRAAGLLVTGLLVVSPTLHPWYWLNALPFALLLRWPAVVWAAGAAPLAYLANLPAAHPVWPNPDAIRAVEYVPALGLLALAWARRPRAGPAA